MTNSATIMFYFFFIPGYKNIRCSKKKLLYGYIFAEKTTETNIFFTFGLHYVTMW